MEKILNNTEVRKNQIESDNSNLFSDWGSRNPEILIREEIDNQIAANPTFAGINIVNEPGSCTIHTFNDGETPTPEMMETMRFIGKTYSLKKGASLCKIGQTRSLVAARKSPTAVSDMTFKSIHNGEECTYICTANGKTSEITTQNSGPVQTYESDIVKKTFTNVYPIDKMGDDWLNYIKAIIAIKIYPYSLINPNFKYIFNNEEITPNPVLYDGIEHEAIQRMNWKDYSIPLHNKTNKIQVSCCYYHKFVKPDGFGMDKKRADKLDLATNLSDKSSGVFVEIGNVVVITGGRDSWKFINDKFHSTLTGIRIYIKIPNDIDIKETIFGESSDKSSINICLQDIIGSNGEKVFQEIISDIHQYVSNWSGDREKTNEEGKLVDKTKRDKIFNDVINNSIISMHLTTAFSLLNEEQKNVIGSKQISTLMKELQNKKTKPCYCNA